MNKDQLRTVIIRFFKTVSDVIKLWRLQKYVETKSLVAVIFLIMRVHISVFDLPFLSIIFIKSCLYRSFWWAFIPDFFFNFYNFHAYTFSFHSLFYIKKQNRFRLTFPNIFPFVISFIAFFFYTHISIKH